MSPPTLPVASASDSLAFLAGVVGPTLAKGPIIRRPRVMALAERLELDRRALRTMQRLHERYGPGPLLLRIPGAARAVILSPEHVRRVLDESPEPFATATTEKRAALAHFEPGAVLISQGPERADRRRYNEEVLRPERAMHPLAQRFATVIEREMSDLLAALDGRPLGWAEFTPTWFRIVRRLVLGDAAGDDVEVTRRLDRLRAAGNWAMLRSRRRLRRAMLFRRLEHHLVRAEEGSLAAVMQGLAAGPRTAPERQVPQWLFAFDATAMATFRALALLATHPDQARAAREEAAGAATAELPCLRAFILESLRLWPTTPLVLRQTTAATDWATGTMPAGTGVIVFAPFFHRDARRQPFADRLAPELWGEAHDPGEWPLIPFSRGPAVCPGRQLALLVGSTTLASLLRRGPVRLLPPTRLGPEAPLPATLNHVALRFAAGG